ncbi:MAG: DUF4384 domain-containing protein [Ignavibacteriales bacterium]|nr:DUF4384 domain-containing protein [Ignavibacteriales bacterium]
MKRLTIICLLLILAISLKTISAQEITDKIKVKMGVMVHSGNKFERLKSKDKLAPGDEFRIFLQPLQDAYLYVIITDENESTLLTPTVQKQSFKANKMVYLPSEAEYYSFDNKSKNPGIAIICSGKRNTQIEKLFASGTSIESSKWQAFETKLETEKQDVDEKSDKPFVIAGNVRAANDDFMNQMYMLSGKDILLKTYDLQIKK